MLVKYVFLKINNCRLIYFFCKTSNVTQVKSKVHPTMSDMEKVQSTLKQIVRDWSKDGEEERSACYNPIIEEIELNFPAAQRLLSYYYSLLVETSFSLIIISICRPSEQVQILVPGAGLGRLAFEIAKRGYSCQGNEFSLFMLFASNFVLNK